MKKLKILIEFPIKGDPNDSETIKEDVYQQLQEMMEEDDLKFDVIDPDEDALDLEDEYEIF